MNYLLKKVVLKRLHLYLCLVAIIVATNNVSAEGWVVNPTTSEKTKDYNDTANNSYSRTGVEDFEGGREVSYGVIYPIAQLSLGYRGDVFETNEDGIAEEKGAATLGWKIGGGYQGSYREHLNGIEYVLEGNEFLSGDNDEDEISHRLNAYWGTAFTPRNHLDLGIEYVDDYDPRSRGDSRRNARFNTSSDDPDRWNELTGGGIYSFGGDTARGRLELSTYLTSREYDNNGQQYRDRDELDLGAAAYFKVLPKTEVYVQVVYTDFDYVDQALTDPTNGQDLDNEETRHLLGLKWYPNQKISGSFRVGSAEKTFQPDSQRQDYDELTWDSNLLWSPNRNNDFGISYYRAPRESFVYTADQLIDDLIEVENLQLSWAHVWSQRLSTTIGYTIGKDNYLPSGRKDDRDEFTIGFSYALPRLGSVGLNYFSRKLESNVAGQDYDDDGITVYFNIGAALGLGDGNTRAPGIRNQRQYRPGYAIY